MARAYKCDRCGKLYENNDIRRDDLVLTTLGLTYQHKIYELCPDCRQELQDWFDIYKISGEEKTE